MKAFAQFFLIFIVLACGGGGGGNSSSTGPEPTPPIIEPAPVRYSGIDPYRLYGKTSYNHLEESDFSYLSGIGARSVRIMLMQGDLGAADDSGLAGEVEITSANREKIIRLLDLGAQYGLTIIFDLHETFGLVRWTGDIDLSIWEDTAEGARKRQIIVSYWKQLAEICKNEDPNAVIYEILNEPEPADENQWYAVLDQSIEAIRKIDPVHTIIATPANAWLLEAFNTFNPSEIVQKDGRILISAHFYLPYSYTHQLEAWAGEAEYLRYPGIIDGVFWNNLEIREKLRPLSDFQDKYPNLPIVIPEFSVMNTAPGCHLWLRDLIGELNFLGIPWFYHVYKEPEYFNARGIPYGLPKFEIQGQAKEELFKAFLDLP